MRSALLCVLILSITAPVSAQELPYIRQAEIPIGPPDRWDYLAENAGLVFVSHGDRVTIVDLRDRRVVRSVETGPGAHGIAIVAGEVFAASGKDGVVSVFQINGSPEARITAAEDADAVAYDPITNRVVSINGDSGSVTVVDPKTRQPTGTITIGGKLESAAADGAGHVLIAGAERREVVVFDPAGAAVVARWPIADCVSPHGLAADPARHRAFVTCVDGHAVLLDTTSGAIAATLDIGRGSDAAGLDAGRHRFLSSNNDGTLDAIDIDEAGAPHALPRVTTEPGARTLAVSPDGTVYTVTATPTGPAGANGRFAFEPGTVRLLVYTPR